MATVGMPFFIINCIVVNRFIGLIDYRTTYSINRLFCNRFLIRDVRLFRNIPKAASSRLKCADHMLPETPISTGIQSRLLFEQIITQVIKPVTQIRSRDSSWFQKGREGNLPRRSDNTCIAFARSLKWR